MNTNFGGKDAHIPQRFDFLASICSYALWYIIILLVLSTVLSMGCTRYNHEFLANCDRVNGETLKCYVCETEWLADFPIVEDHVQIKARVTYTSGDNCGWLYFFYGGKHDSHRIAKEDAEYLYQCVKNGLNYDDDEEWYDDDVYYGDTTTEDLVEDIKEIKNQGGKPEPTPTTTIEPSTKDWRETL